MDTSKVYDIRDLVESIRIGLWWIEDLVDERASPERIDEVVEMLRPLFTEYVLRTAYTDSTFANSGKEGLPLLLST